MNSIQTVRNLKLTENGDLAFKSTGNNLLDIFFMTPYYENHLEEVNIEANDLNRLFAMFIRDPRFGLGRRDLGRKLMQLTEVQAEDIIKAGRFDDLLNLDKFYSFWKKEIENGNQLAKKWAPRLTGKDKLVAKKLAKAWGFTEKQYRSFIKLDNTVEYKLSNHDANIIFEKVPSLAMLKYYNRFKRGEDTKYLFEMYLDCVAAGTKDLKVSTATVYDIYKNRDKIDPDLFFEKLEKISINCLPVIDTSGSMTCQDAMGKALSIGHYLAKCSTFAPNIAVSFSNQPHIIDVTEDSTIVEQYFWYNPVEPTNNYCKEVRRLYTGDCSNTDLAKVMKLAKTFDKVPEYLIVLSDMEFDMGSYFSKEELMDLWKKNGYTTKIVWWNFNGRNKTAPETDEYGNIFISGYNPMMLKYLETGFDGNEFLKKLLKEYKKAIEA